MALPVKNIQLKYQMKQQTEYELNWGKHNIKHYVHLLYNSSNTHMVQFIISHNSLAIKWKRFR